MAGACILSNSEERNATNFQRSTGFGFPPHIIKVNTGEDVASKVLSFTQNCPRDVCIWSATGVLSNVSLIKADMSGRAATYEGQFEIVSLSGSFLLSETGGQRSRTGGLSVSFAGCGGRVFDGSVEGVLTAGSPIQIIVGDLVANGRMPPTSQQQQIPGSTVTHHIIKVKTGEDVSSKLVSFIKNCPRAVCILSATGDLSSVSVLQAGASGGVATYEGLFKIRTLSGSFLPFENGDQRRRTGGFSVSLTGSKRRIFGGVVSGDLIAASPVQVSVCSFGEPPGRMNLKFVGQTGASTPPSRGMYSGSPSELAGQTGTNTSSSRGRYGGLVSELPSHPKSKRSYRVPCE